METPTVVRIFLGLGISESRILPRSGSRRVWSILQRVTPEIVLKLTENVSVEGVRSLRPGKGEGPPTRWSWVGRLEGSGIGRTVNALM